MTEEKQALILKINLLKREKNAIVLAHNYQRPEIYEVADFTGDSLELCRNAAKTNASIIIFSGVHFMAESAAILNPGKKVLVPSLDAGCALSDMITAEDLRAAKEKYPDAAVVTYVNSSADVKAESDIICTSTNAVDVVRSLPNRRILMVPDKNLASYVAKQMPEKEIIPWEGFCPIHHRLNREAVERARKEHPKAKVIAHPECTPDVITEADYVASTSGMIKRAKEDAAKEFIVLTECGMTNRLKQALPNKTFHTVCSLCMDMKKNTLSGILHSLQTDQFEVAVKPEIADRARKAFEKMFVVHEITRQKNSPSLRSPKMAHA